MDAEDSLFISSLFDEDKSFISIDIPFCKTDEKKPKDFKLSKWKISYFNKLDYKKANISE